MNRPHPRRRGFTLIEVMLVLVILVVLVSLVVATYSRTQRTALRRAARVQIGLLEGAIQQYQLEVRNFPPDLQALVERPADLVNPNRWQGPYLEKSIPLDPWDHDYRYELDVTTGTFKIWSAGPDGVDNNDDDITNYDQE
jgi:general secretion pathway protein G